MMDGRALLGKRPMPTYILYQLRENITTIILNILKIAILSLGLKLEVFLKPSLNNTGKELSEFL